MFQGSNVLGSFQFVKVYSSTLTGLPLQKALNKLAKAHLEVDATRAFNRVLRSKDDRCPDRSELHKGIEIWLHFRYIKTKQTRYTWIGARVSATIPRGLKCCGSKNIPAMQVASKNVWIAPKEELSQSLFGYTFKDGVIRPHASLLRVVNARQMIMEQSMWVLALHSVTPYYTEIE